MFSKGPAIELLHLTLGIDFEGFYGTMQTHWSLAVSNPSPGNILYMLTSTRAPHIPPLGVFLRMCSL